MRKAKVDSNQPKIVDTFRKLGCSVVHLHMVGHGCPDIAIGKKNITVLVEIKDGTKAKSARKLTKDEIDFHAEWKGRIEIVESIEDVQWLVDNL